MRLKTRNTPVFFTLAIVACLGVGGPALVAADDAEALKQQNAELRQRLESVEQDLATLKKLLPPVAATPAAAPTPPAAPAQPAPVSSFTDAETAKLKSLASMKGTAVRSSIDLNFYGYVKLDAALDDSRTSLGNFARWMESESVLKNDRHFNLTANQTRLGMDATIPATPSFQATGKLEVDFYGAGTGENKPEPMVRHACVRMDWPKYKLALIAGQTWDIISPLNPNTVNYSVVWWQGNVGYRRPQLRLVKTVDLQEGVELKFDGGISRTITGRKSVFKESNDPDTGADAGFPTLAGRTGLSFPVGGKRVATIGFSGHYGVEEVHQNDLLKEDTYITRSINIDLRLPLSSTLLLQGEAFVGRNFDSHLGGIGQGINLVLQREIDTTGGWASFTFTPSAQWQFNLGAGVDDPDDADLSGNVDPTKDARTKNAVAYANVFYSLNTNVQFAFELARLRTTYKVCAPGTNWRQQFAVIFKF